MDFKELRVKSVCEVLSYRPNISRWTVSDRTNHIIGIKVSGSAMHTMENQSFLMSEGCIYFLNQKDDYRVEICDAGEALSIHFTTFGEIETDSFCFPISNPCEIISSLQKAEKIYREGNELKLLSLIYELCDKFERLRAKPYSHRDGRMTDAKMEIDRSFAEVDCLKNVIRKSGLGDRRFRDLFRGQFNITPNRYITLKKIEYAKGLLSAGGVSVTEVSELCGFSDIYYFSKTFKKLCGTLPSRWK